MGGEDFLLHAADGRHLPAGSFTVMATSCRSRPSQSTRAVASVIPAEGPSFGIAPSGACARRASGHFLGNANSSAFERTQLMAAWADSVTSPSLPVSVRWPRRHERGLRHENLATDFVPGETRPRCSFACFSRQRGRITGHAEVLRDSAVISSPKLLPSTTTLRATLRQIDEISAEFEIAHPGLARVALDDGLDGLVRERDVLGGEPPALDHFGARNRFAISVFSSSV